MSATSVWDAPSGECLRGRGRYGVSLQVTLCDPYLSALSVRYFNKGAIQIRFLSFSFTCTFRHALRAAYRTAISGRTNSCFLQINISHIPQVIQCVTRFSVAVYHHS